MASVTAPGEFYEIETQIVDSLEMKVFKNTPANLSQLFEFARGYGDKPFLIYQDESWSFAATMDLASQIAAVLVNDCGVSKGDRVAIAMRNLPEWVASYAAVLSTGAIATLLNAWWKPDELSYALRDSGAKLLIADHERATRALPSAKSLGIEILVARCDKAKAPAGTTALSDLLSSAAIFNVPEIRPEDPATILYTSGTTGFPKGAISSHRAVLSAIFANGARTAVSAICFPPKTPAQWPISFILGVPLFHVTGCVSILLSATAIGSKLVLMHRWDPGEALAIIEREHITHFIGVPTMAWDLIESPAFATSDTSSLSTVGGGGSAVPPQLIKRIASQITSARPGFGYGMTETNAYGPQIEGEDSLEHPTSAGKTLPIMEVKILGPSGVEVAVGERGEICFFGPNVIRQYWNKPEEAAGSFHGKWLRSGDVGHVDTGGFVYVDDRLKDIVIRGGENIYCAEVEAAIYEHPRVYEAAVFALSDPRLGEEVAAAVMPTPGTALDDGELREYLITKIAAFKVPSQIFITSHSLPRGTTGKIQKKVLREMFDSQSQKG